MKSPTENAQWEVGMSPKQFENQVETFLKNTKKKCQELVQNTKSKETNTAEWKNWFDNVYTDDFINILYHMEMLISEYNHIFKGAEENQQDPTVLVDRRELLSILKLAEKELDSLYHFAISKGIMEAGDPPHKQVGRYTRKIEKGRK